MKITCITCKKEFNVIKDTFLCPYCGYLNPLNNIDFFSYMGISIQLSLNLEDLESKFMLLMMKYHPDNFVSKDLQEKTNSLTHSGYLNKAYNTLKEETSRFAYMYELINGESINYEVDANNSELFIEFLEYYEELENIQHTDNLKNFQDKLKEIKKNVLLKNINVDFTDKKLTYNIYLKLRYIDKIIESSKKIRNIAGS